MKPRQLLNGSLLNLSHISLKLDQSLFKRPKPWDGTCLPSRCVIVRSPKKLSLNRYLLCVRFSPIRCPSKICDTEQLLGRFRTKVEVRLFRKLCHQSVIWSGYGKLSRKVTRVCQRNDALINLFQDDQQ